MVMLVQLDRGGAEYVWNSEEWQWQDLDTGEVSGGGEDEDDFDGSGEEEHLYRENDGGGYNYNTHRLQEESIKVDSGEEIDPHEIDIGFQDTPSSPEPGKGPSTSTEQPQGGETNLFAQPGILAAIVVGTVAGLLLCTILLIMLIVYRMQKEDAFTHNRI